jgi:hypothetical protein
VLHNTDVVTFVLSLRVCVCVCVCVHVASASDVPPISMRHFEDALQSVGASVSTSDLDRYIEWNKTFGTYRRME